MTPRFVRSFSPLVAILFVILIWYVLALIFPPYLFPGIGVTVNKIVGFYQQGILLKNVYLTSIRMVYAFISALILGVLTGILMGYFRTIEIMVKPLIFIIQTIATVVWCFFSVIWFGLSEFAVIFVVFIIGYPIIAINVWEGVKAMDLSLEDMAKSFGVNGAQVIRGITIPSILPHLFAGIRSSVSYCWKILILAELVVGNSGIGYALYFAWEQFRVPEVFGWVVVMIALMLGSEYLLIRPIEAYLMRWRPKRGEV